MKKLYFTAFLLLQAAAGYAAVSGGMLGAGVNYPGAAVRYFLSDAVCLEAKAQTEADVFVGGLRGYRYFGDHAAQTHLFAGLEADMATFTGSVSKGNGFAGEIFIGGEHFLAERLSLQLDLGPAYVNLSDSSTGTSVSGVEFVVTIGINYYFRVKK